MSSPRKNKSRVEKVKQSKGEKAMNRAIESFVSTKMKQMRILSKWEEKHWRRGTESNEK